MPELPEVETVRRGLQPVMEGARFSKVVAHRGDLRWPLAKDFVARLEGKTVKGLGRRAKYLLADLSSNEVLVMHLGMSGSFRVARGRGKATPGRYYHDRAKNIAHDHVVFHMSSGAVVTFNDPRRFGFMDLLTRRELADHPVLSRLGLEPLSPEFDAAALARACKGKRTSLKAALLNQRVVAGLGNIYASEALHLAGLSPSRRASTIATPSGAPRPAAYRLSAAVKQVLARAIERISNASYRSSSFRVYDREGKRCPRARCGGTIRRRTQAGRSTFYCPVCQH
jgi:formamidopyrimidine-DNA glycosylase